MWVTGTYDASANQVIWGTGNPVPMFDHTARPGDNLYTNSVISGRRRHWQDELVLPVYAPGDLWDYDEAGTRTS